MHREIFGCYIGTEVLEVMLLRRRHGQLEVAGYGKAQIENPWAANGQLQDPAGLMAALKQLLAYSRPEPIRTSYCILTLPEDQVFSSVFTLPAGLRPDEVRSTIPFKAEELLPFQADEIYYDFKTLRIEGNGQEVFYAATPTTVVEGLRATLGQAGFIPVALDLTSVTLARAVLPRPVPDAPYLLLDLASQTGSIHIFDRNGIRQRRLLTAPAGRSAKAGPAPEEKATPAKTRAKALPQRWLNQITAQAQALSAGYLELSHRTVQHGVLTGTLALQPQAAEQLSAALGIPVVVGNPLNELIGKALPELRADAVAYAPVVGLALRGLSRSPEYDDINLLPFSPPSRLWPARTDARAWKRLKAFTAVLAGLIIILGTLLGLRGRGIDVFRIFFNAIRGVLIQEPVKLSPPAPIPLPEPLPAPEPEATTTPTSTPPAGQEGRDIFKPAVPKVKVLPNDLGYLNVRQGPGTSYQKIGQVQIGQEFGVLGESGEWVKIDLGNGKEGWVHVNYVETVKE